MWKKIRYVLYFAILISVFSVTYKFREYYYVPIIQQFINKVTDSNLQFRSFSIDLPFTLVLHDIEYKKAIFIDKASLRFEPLEYLKNIRVPLKSLSFIKVNKVVITDSYLTKKEIKEEPTNNNKYQKIKINVLEYILSLFNLNCEINRLIIFNNNKILKAENVNVSLNREIDVGATIYEYKHKIHTKGNLKLDSENVLLNFYTEINGLLKSKFDLIGSYNLVDNSFDFNLDAKELFLNRLDFGKSQTSIKKSSESFTVNSLGENLNLSFNAKNFDFDLWNSTGTVKVRDISDVLETNLSYKITSKNKIIDLVINTKDTKVFGNNFGNFKYTADNKSGLLNMLCVHDSGNTFKTIIQDNGDYFASVYNKQNQLGHLSGNYKKGEVSVDVKNLPVKKIPFIENFSKTIKGTVSLYGKIGTQTGTIYLKGNQISSKKIKGLGIEGKLYKQNYNWFAEILTQDKKIFANGFYETKKNNGIDVYYNSVDINNVLQILGVNKPQISGKLTGSTKYLAKDSNVVIDMNLKDGTLFGNKYSQWTMVGNVSNENIKISTFTFNGLNSNIVAKSFIDFKNINSDSYLNLLVKDFKIKNLNTNYNLTVNGKLVEENKIVGKVDVPKLSIGNFNFPHQAICEFSKEKLILRDFDNGNGFSGEVEYDISKKTISSFFKFLNSKLSQHFSKLKGRLSSDIKVFGDIKNPEVSFNGKIKNGLYNDLLFNIDSVAKYKDQKLKLNHFKALLGNNQDSTIEAFGYLDNNNSNIQVDFKNISEKIINKYVGFRTPLKATFYGDGRVTGKFGDLKYLLNLYADTLFVKDMKFNSFASKVTAKDKVISIEDAKIKIADSEIKILSADFDAKTYKYNSKLKFVNTHLGPFDVFGNVKISGKMFKQKQAYEYKGEMDFINLWLNDERIDLLTLEYNISDKKFIFNSIENSDLSLSGGILFNKYPKISFKDILLKYQKQYYKLDGSILSDELDINMVGKKLDLETITGLFNFSSDMKGDVNFNLKCNGKISNPNIDLSIDSSNGSFYNVPYDICDISLKAKNNKATIEKCYLKKTGKYNFTIDGYFPFWLDSSLKKELMKQEVSIDYKLEDNNLYILNNLFGNSMSVKKGSLIVQGELKGIRKNISNEGNLILTGTNIKTNSYVNKIKNLSVDISWDKNIFKIKECVAKVGSGILEATGTVKMQGITPSVYDLHFFTSKKGIPVTIKELPIASAGVIKVESGKFADYSKGVPYFDVSLTGTSKRLDLKGWVALENTKFCFPSPVDTPDQEIPDFVSELFKNLYIDIDLKSATNTRFENSYTSLLIRGGVNLKGPLDNILSNGIITSTDGLFSYIGNDFDILNAKLEIINNEVFLTAEAESEVYSNGDSTAEVIKVYVDRSSIDNLKTRFASKNDPTMDSKTALARLTKTDPSKITATDTSTDFLVKQQAIRMFSSSVATPLANSVLKKTGLIDNVRIGFVNQDTLQLDADEEATMAELLYGMKYSVEKNINRLLQVGYSVTFDKIQREIDLKQAVEMSFKLNRNLFLKGSYGLKSDNPDYEPEKKFMIEQRLRF